MTNYSIPLIKPTADIPGFTIDFRDFIVEEPATIKTLSERTKEFAKCFFSALKEATCVTLGRRMLWASFKITVLGYYGGGDIYQRPPNFIFIIFKTAMWILQLSWCVVATTNRLLLEKLDARATRSSLSPYQSDEINTHHIKTKELELDASNVPSTVQVNQLIEMLNKANFDDPTAPGYMAPSARREGSKTFSKNDLIDHITQFVHRVEGRTPFLGTPPGYDTPRLLAFYQQIENAVRLSIHKVNEDLRIFLERNPGDPALYEGAVKQNYHELLQAQTRVALDLAIAGAHCGGRYMGDTMTVYGNLYDKGEVAGSLEDEILEVLARKRKEIAEQQVAKHNSRQDTHFFAAYMSELGGPLALPGTKNIIEQLTTVGDKQRYIDLFFGAPDTGTPTESYTVDTIIKTIQEHVNKSGTFRDKIVDWIKDQAKDWNKPKYDALKQSVQTRIQAILAQPAVADPGTIDALRAFHKLAIDAMQNSSDAQEILKAEDWDDFTQEVLATEPVKKWMKDKTLEQKQAIREACRKLGAHTTQTTAFRDSIVQKVPFDFTLLAQSLATDTQVRSIRSVFADPDLQPPPSDETLLRMIKGDPAQLDEILQDYLDLTRRNAFFEQFTPFETLTDPELKRPDGSVTPEIITQRMPKELIEWLLVSHHVLMTQASKKQEETTLVLPDPIKRSRYFETVKAGFQNCSIDNPAKQEMMAWLDAIHRPHPDLASVEEGAQRIIEKFPDIARGKNQRRYPFTNNCFSIQLMKILFDHAFHSETEVIIKAAEHVHAKKGPFYPTWKKVTHIQIPHLVGSILGNPLIKLILAIAAIYPTIMATLYCYQACSDFTVRVIIPMYINKTPIGAVRFCNTLCDRAWDAKTWVLKNFGKLIIAYVITALVAARLRIPYLQHLNRIQLGDVMGLLYFAPATIGSYAIGLSMSAFSFTLNTCTNLANQCKCISTNASSTRLNLSREKAYAIWNTIMHQVLEGLPNLEQKN